MEQNKKKFPWWLVIVGVVIFGLGYASHSPSDDQEKAMEVVTEAPSEQASSEEVSEEASEKMIVSASEDPSEVIATSQADEIEEVEPPTKASTTLTKTSSNDQALKTALRYLEHQSFSHDGLIGQLEYEGFTTEEATAAVDKCGADWNEQAAKKAVDYLDNQSFSYTGLVEQLEYEGFTPEQAAYGVGEVYE